MAGKQVTELDALPSFTDTSLLPVHNGAGLKKGTLSQLVNYLGPKFSNPNLLINPDFKINQRGQSTYTSGNVIYTVDRWKIWSCTVSIDTSGYINIVNNTKDIGIFRQQLENAVDGPSTLSCYVTSVSGTAQLEAGTNNAITLKQGLNIIHTDSETNSFKITIHQGGNITLKWAKLEQGSVATPFVAPNYADELLKCQRYFMYIPSSVVGYKFTSQIFVQLEKVNNMRRNVTIKITGSNNDTNVISTDSVKQNVSVNVGACKANIGSSSIGIYIDGTGTIQNTLVGIDFNSTKILLDAEIY